MCRPRSCSRSPGRESWRSDPGLATGIRRHVAQPCIKHVADIDFAGRVLATAAAMLVGQITGKSAANLDPLRSLTGETERDTIVDFEIVGQHQRSSSVD